MPQKLAPNKNANEVTASLLGSLFFAHASLLLVVFIRQSNPLIG